VTFVDDLDRAVAAARDAAGEKYVNVLGAATARACLRAGVLDEILTIVAPVLLGDGVRLFDGLSPEAIDLERTRTIATPSATHLRFAVVARTPPGR
jgi:dihydrofolate reductase